MFDAMLMRASRWAITRLGRNWLDYLVSNTMTDFNRRLNPFLWTYQLKAVVISVKQETEDVKTFRLMPNQHWQTLTAGQYVEVLVGVNGEQHRRHYSVSPMQDDSFTITVKRVPGGLVSDWMHDHLQVGMTVLLNPPQGDFCYREQPAVLFLCAGSGITPCYSMISDLLQRRICVDIRLYAQFSTAAEVIFADTLSAWSSTSVAVEIALTRDDASLSAGSYYQPALDAASFAKRFPDFRERDIYLCGPQGFMEKVVRILEAEGYDTRRLHVERFVSQNELATSLNNPLLNSYDVSGSEIYFRHLDTRVQLTDADQGKSLLQLAEDHGVELESGCRRGMCGTCKLTLREGHIAGHSLGSAVYLCSAYPASRRVVLDA